MVTEDIPHPTATVVITTRNRKEELATAIESCLRQTVPIEVIVIDDASTDGTGDMVRERFPGVRYLCIATPAGYIVNRNRGARMASTPIIFSIDDDAAFKSDRTVEQTLPEFDHPRVGAVAIPYANVLTSPHVFQRAATRDAVHVLHSYVGTAHALRRDLFLSLNGYREVLQHQCEEGDYCVRMLAAGYVVRAGSADAIDHFESPKRDWAKVLVLNARNHVLFAWHNVPFPFMLAHTLGTSFNLLRLGLARSCLPAAWRGLWRGYAHIIKSILGRGTPRAPVPRWAYRLTQRLKRHPMTLPDIEHLLPPLESAPERTMSHVPA